MYFLYTKNRTIKWNGAEHEETHTAYKETNQKVASIVSSKTADNDNEDPTYKTAHNATFHTSTTYVQVC